MGSTTDRRESSGGWQKANALHKTKRRVAGLIFTDAVTLHDRQDDSQANRCSQAPGQHPETQHSGENCRRRGGTLRATLCLLLTSASNSPDGFSFLARRDGEQDERFQSVFAILAQAIKARAFPGCSLAVTYRGELIAHKALGRFTYEPSSATVATILFSISPRSRK